MEDAARASEDCPQQIQSGLALALDWERIVKDGSLWLLNRKWVVLHLVAAPRCLPLLVPVDCCLLHLVCCILC